MIAVEAIIVFAAVFCAYLLSFEQLPHLHVWRLSPLVVLVRIAFLYRYRLVRGWWRYTGFAEIVDLTKASLAATLVLIGLRHLHLLPVQLPFSFFVLEAILSPLSLGLVRMVPRLIFNFTVTKNSAGKRLVIIGAGTGAHLIVNELRQPGSGYTVVACLDDNPTKRGVRIGGVRVQGSCELLPRIVKEYRIDEALIAIPSASPQQMFRFVGFCDRAGIPCRTLPRLRDIVAGELVQQIRDVQLQDLLGRDPIASDLESVAAQINGRVVMVTGAAGSIGSELCVQLLEYRPARLICLDQSETGMFFLERELKKRCTAVDVRYIVANVAKTARVARMIGEHRVQVIFHAAAYKHVPIMEQNIEEALDNNVYALLRFLEAAERAGVTSFVLISSDKAVNPTSVMGVTKRIGELIIASRPRGRMTCVAVRFGNVLGSSGSVVPILQQQIRTNSAITITHPEIKRFFMTIPEAVSLVLQAYVVGGNGDLLVLDMGRPVRIIDLAKDLIRRSGKTESQVPIRFIGLREGEKLEEELFYASEQISATAYAKVLRTRSRGYSWSTLNQMLARLEQAVLAGDTRRMRAGMKAIVPEYEWPAIGAHLPPHPKWEEAARRDERSVADQPAECPFGAAPEVLPSQGS